MEPPTTTTIRNRIKALDPHTTISDWTTEGCEPWVKRIWIIKVQQHTYRAVLTELQAMGIHEGNATISGKRIVIEAFV